MSEGVKETKELLKGLLSITALLAEVLKDGFQVADFGMIMAKIGSNPELKAKLEAAYADIEKVKVEVADISLIEGFELIQASIPEIVAIVEAIKKPVVVAEAPKAEETAQA